jgi:uncharacterized coiled-coil protein SlyX
MICDSMNEAKLDDLERRLREQSRELARLNSKVQELSAELHNARARIISISETLEDQSQH